MQNTEQVIVNWYLVSFVDILGQRQLLRGLRKLPDNTDQDEKEAFIKILMTKMVYERFFLYHESQNME